MLGDERAGRFELIGHDRLDLQAAHGLRALRRPACRSCGRPHRWSAASRPGRWVCPSVFRCRRESRAGGYPARLREIRSRVRKGAVHIGLTDRDRDMPARDQCRGQRRHRIKMSPIGRRKKNAMRATIWKNRMQNHLLAGQAIHAAFAAPHVTVMLLTNFQIKEIFKFFNFHADIMQQFFLLLVK